MKNKGEDKRCKVYSKKYVTFNWSLRIKGKKRTEAISEEIMSKNFP